MMKLKNKFRFKSQKNHVLTYKRDTFNLIKIYEDYLISKILI